MKYQHGLTAKFITTAHIVLLCLVVIRGAAQDRTWTTDKVERGLTTSIAVDRGHNLHLVYLTPNAKVYYAIRPSGASRWLPIKLVESTHSIVHIYPRVAADESGKPYVCVGTGKLLYVSLQASGWVTQEIDPGSGTLSYHCSIALGPDGTPHLSWYHEFLPNGKQYSHFRHAGLEDGVWVVRSVDGGISGKWNSMVIDSKGFPHASYSQWIHGGDLDYAVWNGSNWDITDVDSSHNSSTYRGFNNSLALAADGSAHISYLDFRTLKYAYQDHGKWVIEKVDTVASGYDPYVGGTAMLLDSHGDPHIVYSDFGSIKHAYRQGKEWKIDPVVSGALQQYENVDAAIGTDDTLYISYADPDDGYVKVAIGKISPTIKASK